MKLMIFPKNQVENPKNQVQIKNLGQYNFFNIYLIIFKEKLKEKNEYV